jgi:hypothetical protein
MHAYFSVPAQLLYSRRSICEGSSSAGRQFAELTAVLQQERYATVHLKLHIAVP